MTEPDKTGRKPLTPIERKSAERERRRKLGSKRLELWAHPEDHSLIKTYAGLLAYDRSNNQSDIRRQMGVLNQQTKE